MAKSLREADLTAAEWRMWSYLVTLEPFGDRYIELPSALTSSVPGGGFPLDNLTLMAKCSMSKATVYRAIAKFQELELFDFEARLRFRNLKAEGKVSKMRQNSQKCESGIKNKNVISVVRQSIAEVPANQECFLSQTVQTPQTISEAAANKLRSKEENAELDHLLASGREQDYFRRLWGEEQ